MGMLTVRIAKLQEEKMGLADKIDKLNDFLKTNEFKKINRTQKFLLPLQLDIMMTYYDILSARICNLLHERDKEIKKSHRKNVEK